MKTDGRYIWHVFIRHTWYCGEKVTGGVKFYAPMDLQPGDVCKIVEPDCVKVKRGSKVYLFWPSYG